MTLRSEILVADFRYTCCTCFIALDIVWVADSAAQPVPFVHRIVPFVGRNAYIS